MQPLPLKQNDDWNSIKDINKWLKNCMSDNIEDCNGKWEVEMKGGRFEQCAIQINCGNKYRKYLIMNKFFF